MKNLEFLTKAPVDHTAIATVYACLASWETTAFNVSAKKDIDFWVII